MESSRALTAALCILYIHFLGPRPSALRPSPFTLRLRSSPFVLCPRSRAVVVALTVSLLPHLSSPNVINN